VRVFSSHDSRADHIKSEIDQAAGDIRATWRTAPKLLHSSHKVVTLIVYNQFLLSLSSSSTKWDAFRTTSKRHCSYQSVARLPSVSISDQSCPHLSQWPLRKCESCCPACLLSRHRSMSCRARYWSRVLMRLRQPLLDSPTCHCRLESFRPDTRQMLQLLKKAGLDSSQPANYRPISNLSTVSKVLFLSRSASNCRRPSTPLITGFSSMVCGSSSEWRRHHATGCSRSYLEGRTQIVKMGQHQSQATGVDVGVPQGSVLGPLLFAVYCSPIAVIAHHGVQYHQYADDTQLLLAMRVDNTPAGCPLSPIVHWRQTVVPAERPRAQLGQVRSSRRWNDQSDACGDVR